MLSKFFAKKDEPSQEAASQSSPPADPPVKPPSDANPPADAPPTIQGGILRPPTKTEGARTTGKQKRITQRITIAVTPPAVAGAKSPALKIVLPGAEQSQEQAAAPSPSASGNLELPMSIIVGAIPEKLLASPADQILSGPHGNSNATIPMASVVGMLPSGKVEFTLKDFSAFVPAEILQPIDQVGDEIISLPLAEIVKRVPPEALTKRPDQKPIDEKVKQIPEPFSPDALKAAAEEKKAEAPATSETPATPEAATPSETPQIPEIPSTPEIPAVPEATASVPEPVVEEKAPEIPPIPEAVTTPEVPAVPEASVPEPVPEVPAPVSEVPAEVPPTPVAETPAEAPPTPVAETPVEAPPTPAVEEKPKEEPAAEDTQKMASLIADFMPPGSSTPETPATPEPAAPQPPAESSPPLEDLVASAIPEPVAPAEAPKPEPPPASEEPKAITEDLATSIAAIPDPTAGSIEAPVEKPPAPAVETPAEIPPVPAEETPVEQPAPAAEEKPAGGGFDFSSFKQEESATPEKTPEVTPEIPSVSEPVTEEKAPEIPSIPEAVAGEEKTPETPAFEEPKVEEAPKTESPMPEVSIPAAATSVPTIPSSGNVNLNQCTLEELTQKAGCPEAIARKILAWRELHGPFVDLHALWEVPGMTDDVYHSLVGQPDEESAVELSEIFGLPPQSHLTVKEVSTRIRNWPFMTGCVIGGMEGLPIAFDCDDKKFAKAICAFAPKIIQQTRSTLEEMKEPEANEIHLIKEDHTISIFRCEHLVLITINRKKGLSVRDVEMIRQVVAKLASVKEAKLEV